MILRIQEVDDLRHEVARGRVSAKTLNEVSGISLEAAFELACWRLTQQTMLDPAVVGLLDGWTQQHHSLRRAWVALADGIPDEVELHATPPNEIRPIPPREELEEDVSPWMAYRLRFRRALVELGHFNGEFADALCRALHEMVDNVLQHSQVGPHPAAGLVGYHVKANRACYSVADVGRGVLASLRSNPKHAALANSREALQAAVEGGATRRTHMRSGDGFRQVFRALADVGTLRFRSGDGRLTIKAQDAQRVATAANSPQMAGLQVAIHVVQGSLNCLH